MKYKVGDKVRVREWGDMLDEFGGDEFGILTSYFFIKVIRQFCGRTVTIRVCDDARNCYRIVEDEGAGLVFTDEMFKDINDCPMLLGFDIYNFVKEFSEKNFNCSDSMTDEERVAYVFGKGQILNLLRQVLNEFFKEENSAIPTYIVHVPGLNTATDFASINEIQEQFGGKDL